jgi:hypothetical protein
MPGDLSKEEVALVSRGKKGSDQALPDEKLLITQKNTDEPAGVAFSALFPTAGLLPP